MASLSEAADSSAKQAQDEANRIIANRIDNSFFIAFPSCHDNGSDRCAAFKYGHSISGEP